MGCWLLWAGQRIYKKDEQSLGVVAMRIFFPIKSQIVIDRVRGEGWGVLNTDLSNISIFNLAEGWRVRDEKWGVRGKGRGLWERGGGGGEGQKADYVLHLLTNPSPLWISFSWQICKNKGNATAAERFSFVRMATYFASWDRRPDISGPRCYWTHRLYSIYSIWDNFALNVYPTSLLTGSWHPVLLKYYSYSIRKGYNPEYIDLVTFLTKSPRYRVLFPLVYLKWLILLLLVPVGKTPWFFSNPEYGRDSIFCKF